MNRRLRKTGHGRPPAVGQRPIVDQGDTAVDGFDGLVRSYRQPFSEDDFDALEPAQVFLARYAADGALVRER